MALYTDGPVFGLEELAAYETNILQTASEEGINLTTKIELAREEVGMELQYALQRTSLSGAVPGLEQVAVTGALRLWQTFHTLSLFYRDAHHSQLNDRYRGKWIEYRNLAAWAAGLLYQTGVGIVCEPVPEPKAPTVDVVPGGLGAGGYTVVTAWVNARGEESKASGAVSVQLGGNETLRVTMVESPPRAVAWNVYAGADPSALSLQNATPLAVDASWTAPELLSLTGRQPGKGQQPDLLRQIPRFIQRA